MLKRYKKYFLIGVIIAIVSALMLPSQKTGKIVRDFADIKKEGTLRVTIENGNLLTLLPILGIDW